MRQGRGGGGGGWNGRWLMQPRQWLNAHEPPGGVPDVFGGRVVRLRGNLTPPG
jgi:hypothetical protein